MVHFIPNSFSLRKRELSSTSPALLCGIFEHKKTESLAVGAALPQVGNQLTACWLRHWNCSRRSFRIKFKHHPSARNSPSAIKMLFIKFPFASPSCAKFKYGILGNFSLPPPSFFWNKAGESSEHSPTYFWCFIASRAYDFLLPAQKLLHSWKMCFSRGGKRVKMLFQHRARKLKSRASNSCDYCERQLIKMI